MAPLIRPGDRLVVRWMETATAPRAGDVVVRRCDDGLFVAHRVLRAAPCQVVSKGDASIYEEKWDFQELWGVAQGLETASGRSIDLGGALQRTVFRVLSLAHGVLPPLLRKFPRALMWAAACVVRGRQ